MLQSLGPTDDERVLPPGRLSFTISNRRGIIQSGDMLFAQLSARDPASIAGAHHRFLRHPDMPRAVFARSWELLHAGGSAAAYVKNLSADGRFFWVFSAVIPVCDGHVAIRSAPRGPLFGPVSAAYRRLHAVERQGEGMAAQLARMDGELAALGFPDFTSFMARVLQSETAHLPADTGSPGLVRSEIVELRSKIAGLDRAQRELAEAVRALHLIPTNMRIIASRLEPSGGPVSAIADRYKHDSAELIARMIDGQSIRNGSAAPLIEVLDDMLIHDAIIRLLTAAACQAEGQAESQGGFGLHSGAQAAALMRASCDAPPEGITVLTPAELRMRLHQVRHGAEAVIRLMAGLEQVRILGEVESSRVRDDDQGLSAVVAQLRAFHDDVRERLRPMMLLLRHLDVAV